MSANARLDLRLTASDKQRIERAAQLRGMPLAAFVRTAVLREADEIVTSEAVIALSAAESRRFVRALQKPLKANPALKRALLRGDKLGL